MTSTRKEIRVESATRLDGGFLQSTCTSGSTSSLVDTARLLDSSNSDQEHIGKWIWWQAEAALYSATGATVRAVSGYAKASGTLSHTGSAWSGSPDAGDGYELHGILDPRDWNAAINRALRRCTRLRRDELAIVDARLNYPLDLFDWVETKRQVRSVLLRTGDTPNQYTWTELGASLWDVTEEDDAYVLNLKQGGFTQSDTQALFVETDGPYRGDMDSDTDRTTCPFDLIVALTLQAAFERHEKQIDERGRKLTDAVRVTREAERMLALYHETEAQPMALDDY